MTVPVTPGGLLLTVCRLLVPPELSLLIISRSATESLSVAVLGTPAEVTVAEFDIVPMASELTVPVTVYVIELPEGSKTPVSSMFVPGVLLFVLPVAPPDALDVQLFSLKPEGKVSVIVAPGARLHCPGRCCRRRSCRSKSGRG